MRPVNPNEYTSALEQELAPRIKQLLDRTSPTRGENEPVGFTTSEVRDAVLNVIKQLRPGATNVPTGPVQAASRINVGAKQRDTEGVIRQIEKIHSKQVGTAGSICITLVGEAHQDLQGKATVDQDRARSLLKEMTTNGRLAFTDVLVLERDHEKRYKPYPQPFAPDSVLESNIPRTISQILEQGLDRDQRDIVLAGYLFLVIAGGDQSTVDTVVLLRGSLHAGFLDRFEYFAKTTTNVTGIDWVGRRPRQLVMVDSLVS